MGLATTLIDEVVSALRAEHTHFDLRGEDAVVLGAPTDEVELDTQVWVVPVDVSPGQFADTGTWRRTWRIEFEGYAAGAALDETARYTAAIGLAEDMVSALEALYHDPTSQMYEHAVRFEVGRFELVADDNHGVVFGVLTFDVIQSEAL